MGNKRDYSDMKFGMLTAIKPTRKKRNGTIVWKCLCDCGSTKEETPYRLKQSLERGAVVSCGCTTRFPPGSVARKRLIKKYQTRPAAQKLGWQLTREEAEALFQSDCFYCGSEPIQIQRRTHGRVGGEYIYNGIDRQNNDLGYVPGNAVACCGLCNLMKRSMSVDQFLSHIRRIVIHNR